MAAPRPPAAPSRDQTQLFLPALIAGLLACFLGPHAAMAAFFGEPAPAVPLHHFRHGVDVDYAQRQVNSSRWNPRVTMRNTRIVARETYGLFAWRDLLVNVSGMFGVSRATIDFGAVNLGDAFWDDYAPDLVRSPPDWPIAPLRFGEDFGASFGASARARLFHLGDLPFAVGGQLLYSQSNDIGQPAMRMRSNEWDFWAGTQWSQKHMGFYAGVNASILIAELSLPNQATDLDEVEPIGVFSGLKMIFYRHLLFAVDLRLINQTAMSGQMIYEF